MQASMKRSPAQIIATLKYLGYVTHFADGTPNPIAEAVARDLSEREACESVMLVPVLAEFWNKHARAIREANR